MANNTMVRGFVPVSTNGQNVPTVTRAKKVSSAAAIYKYSPVVVASGVVDTVATTSGSNMTGSVVQLFDSNGVAVESLATGDAGTCVITCDPDQVFQAVVLSTNYATTDAGNQGYLISAEGGTCAPYSDRTIGADSSTPNVTTNGTIVAGGLVKRPDNAAATAYCEIYCTINPNEFSAA